MHLSGLQSGALHLPVHGVCAAVGLVAALLLSPVTARQARLNPDKVWDAVVAIALAALVISRALLVMGSFRFFQAHPLLVLGLPTVNDTGLLLTALLSMGYLRWKGLSLLRFLDAMAPCAVLLWACLSLSRVLDGTRQGMPTRFGGVWPVELLTTLAAGLLCAGLLRAMRIFWARGRVCSAGLVAAGVAVFALDFLRLPSDLAGAGILDPVQWLGLAMIVGGCALVIAVPRDEVGIPDAL